MALVLATGDEQDAAIYLTPPSQAGGAASCSRCAGAVSTSRARRSTCGPAASAVTHDAEVGQGAFRADGAGHR